MKTVSHSNHSIWNPSPHLTWAVRASIFLVATVVAIATALPLIANAAPKNLRTDEDINDVVDGFMSDMVAGQVSSAYRGLAGYSPDLAPKLVSVISEATQQRRELRKRIGLSLGAEAVGLERAGERVVRVTRLERFDEGALAWRLIFYRADSVWQVVDVSFSEDLGVLFGDAPRATHWNSGADARAGQTEGVEDRKAADAAADSAGPGDGTGNEAEPGTEPAFDYDIDLDGRL